MMVTVLEPGGGASTVFAAASGAFGAEPASPSWRACCLPSRSPSRALWVEGGVFVATTAVGSPPSGSLTKAAHATTTTPDRPERAGQQLRRGDGQVQQPFSLVLAEGRVQVVCHGARSSRIIARV